MHLLDGTAKSARNPDQSWCAIDAEHVLTMLGATERSGLSAEEARRRLQQRGPNELTAVPGTPAWRRFGAQCSQPLVLVLIVATVVTAWLGDWIDSAVILGVVVVNALIGYFQEGHAEAALKALLRSVSSEVVVVRDGVRCKIPSQQLVSGDIVILTPGDRIPADLRLVCVRELRTNEAGLTGESLPVDKQVDPVPAEAGLADRKSIGFAGTTVVAGSGSGVVVATGDATETGKIARAIAETPSLDTPLTRHLAVFSNRLLIAIGVLAVLTFGIGWWRGEGAYSMFIAAVALAVGAIPEGLPAAVTVTLAIGVSRLAHRRAVIRRMPAVEALGSTTIICTDKTGTLTENEMTVREVFAARHSIAVSGKGYHPDGKLTLGGDVAPLTGALRELVMAGVLCNDAGLHRVGHRWDITGDPTEAALLVFARKAGIDEVSLRHAVERLDERPFTSETQSMATLDLIEGVGVIHLKGALERVLPRCAAWIDPAGESRALDAAERSDLEREAERMAAHGLRVLVLAQRRLDPSGGQQAIDDAMLALPFDFLGLVGMIDPPRTAAVAAVKVCHRAGISVRMITGDHAVTALAVARQIGIVGPGDSRVMTGVELAGYDDAALQEAVAEVRVFARIEPAQKLRLVQAFQARGETVAMTGDGVNDAPALKAADIGIAMGRGGTEVAKEAADMVLTDDNFATIEAAIQTGRGVYDNLVKFVTWTLPTNFGEGLVILAAIVAGVALPITPLQILWINMTTAVLLGMPLAFEPVENDVMHRPPRAPGVSVIDAPLVRRIVLVSVFMLAGAFGLFTWHRAQGASLAEARTVAMNVFVMIEVFYLLNCRSLRASFWSVGINSNRWIWGGMASMMALQGLITYHPAMNFAFATAPIGWLAWAQILVVALLASLGVAIEKRWQSGLAHG